MYKEKRKTESFNQINRYKILPITFAILQELEIARQQSAREQAILAGQAAQGGDGWHSSTYRIMQDELWVKAAFSRVTESMFTLSELLPKPDNIETIEQGHAIQLSLNQLASEDYGYKVVRFHLLSSVDVTFLDSYVKKFPEFADESNLLISVESPVGILLLGKCINDKVNYKSPVGLYTMQIKSIDISELFDVTSDSI